jgi:hypothetical protein
MSRDAAISSPELDSIMNRRMSAVVFALIANGLCLGQSGPSRVAAMPAACVALPGSWSVADASPQKTSPADQKAAEASVIIVRLSKSLDSRKLTAGDSIEAKLTAELRWSGAVIPRGSKVLGHVTEASSRARGDPASALGMVFDRIVLKDGTNLPLKAKIQAVGPRPGFGPPEAEADNSSPIPVPGAPGTMGGPPNPVGVGGPQTNFPPNPSAGMPPTPAQSNRQDSIAAQSVGVVGLPDLQLGPDSILASSSQEVKLAAGSRLLLRVQSQ